MKINTNEEVKVILTKEGAEIYNTYIDSKTYPHATVYEGQGLELQLWQLMFIFGNTLTLGMNVPFKDNVIIYEGHIELEKLLKMKEILK